jgi:RNA polymerase sigma-70 factor (ECF subfamily)
LQPLDDIELLRRLSRDEKKSFEIIYERYWERLYHLCFYYTLSREEAEDLVMNVFTSLWKNRSGTEISNLEYYLVKAAKNQSLKFILKQQRKREQLHILKERNSSLLDSNHSPDQLLEAKELSSRFYNNLKILSPKTQKIFLLNREKGFTYEQIARALGISIKTVEYHISKALHILSSLTR